MESLQFFSLIGMGMIAAVTAVILRQHRPEFAMLVSVAAGVFIFGGIISGMRPVVNQVRDIFALTSMPQGNIQVIFRALGICFLTQIACDACKDAGENAIGAKVELAGKITVMAISLPLFGQVLGIVRSLLM